MLFQAEPSPEPSGTPIGQLFTTLYHFMRYDMVYTAFGYSFSLWDVFVWSIVLSLLGYVLGKLLNPWGHDHEE